MFCKVLVYSGRINPSGATKSVKTFETISYE